MANNTAQIKPSNWSAHDSRRSSLVCTFGATVPLSISLPRSPACPSAVLPLLSHRCFVVQNDFGVCLAICCVWFAASSPSRPRRQGDPKLGAGVGVGPGVGPERGRRRRRIPACRAFALFAFRFIQILSVKFFCLVSSLTNIWTAVGLSLPVPSVCPFRRRLLFCPMFLACCSACHVVLAAVAAAAAAAVLAACAMGAYE